MFAYKVESLDPKLYTGSLGQFKVEEFILHVEALINEYHTKGYDLFSSQQLDDAYKTSMFIFKRRDLKEEI